MNVDDEIPTGDSLGERLFEDPMKRLQVANQLYTWLLDIKNKENTRDQSLPSLQEMATEVLKGLQSGKIFFIVSDLKEGEPNLNPRLLDVKTEKGLFYAAALSVSKEITIKELLESGDEVIRKMYLIHKEQIKEKIERDVLEGKITSRATVNDPIKIKVPGIGRFPESVKKVEID